ncbi:hypothetical protein LZ30DRAFT_200843 [Colletotrichum cereale]|nr:hypothetical protein LZ30DRAFT_200843 [Colletotrichum cereale]
MRLGGERGSLVRGAQLKAGRTRAWGCHPRLDPVGQSHFCLPESRSRSWCRENEEGEREDWAPGEALVYLVLPQNDMNNGSELRAHENQSRRATEPWSTYYMSIETPACRRVVRQELGNSNSDHTIVVGRGEWAVTFSGCDCCMSDGRGWQLPTDVASIHGVWLRSRSGRRKAASGAFHVF